MRPILPAACLAMLLASCAAPPPPPLLPSPAVANERASAALAAGHSQEALDNFMIAAKQGDHDGELGIGMMYFTGNGVVKDYGEATHWLTAPADAGNNSALYTLGLINETGGGGVLQNRKTAFVFFRRAAEKGHVDAQYSVGNAYNFGLGIPTSYPMALQWYQRASASGNSSATTAIGVLYAEGRGVTQNFKTAMTSFVKASNAGNAEAMRRIGNMYFNGDGVAHNDTLAYNWLRRAAAAGSESAARRLATTLMPDS